MLRLSKIWHLKTLSGWLLCFWLIPIILGVALSFLVIQDVPGLFNIFPIPTWKQPFFPKEPSREWYLEAKIWGLVVLIAIGVSVPLSFLKMCMCVLWVFVCILWLYFCICVKGCSHTFNSSLNTAFLLSIFITPFSNRRKLVLFLLIYLFIWSILLGVTCFPTFTVTSPM